MTSYVQAAEELRGNTEQWAAYEARGNCVVLAGPGSGKTKLLTTKLARVATEDVRHPRGVACVTYSTECVRELRRRLDRLSIDDSGTMFIGTVHAFCLRHILLPYGRLGSAAVPDPLLVAGPKQQAQVFRSALKLLRMGEVRGLKTMFGKFRRDQLDSGAWDLDDDVARLARTYELELTRQGLVDFELMIREAVLLVERHEWVRNCLRARFPILVVDEYQDLGTALHRLVLSLCFKAAVRLIAVGDPNQSIYGFNGAHPEHLQQLGAREDVEAFRLSLNYRSGSKIVAASKAVLTTQVEDKATQDEAGIVAYPGCEGGIDGEAQYLVDKLLPQLLQRWKPGDILIAFRSKREGEPVEKALTTAGYEYVKAGSSSAYPKTPLTRFLEDVARWCVGGWRDGDPKVSRLLQAWVRLQTLPNSDVARSERLRLVRFMFEHRDTNMSAGHWLQVFERKVLMGGDARVRLAASGEVEAFDELRETLRPGNALGRFSVRNLAGQGGSGDYLNLVTLHSSKGSEFPVVVLVGADEGSFPWGNAKPADAEEDRRLFYVGVSRAKSELHVLWSKPVPGDPSRQGPSRFLRDMHERRKVL